MTKETHLTKSDQNLPTTRAQATYNILPSDVVIPRLMLCQGTSDAVKERKAQLGDIIRSTDSLKLGDPETPVQFIPLAEPSTFWILESRAKGAQRWEFKGTEERNARNDNAEWYFNADKDGNLLDKNAPSTHEWRRVKALSLYALLPSDIESEMAEMKKAEKGEFPDLSKALTPILMTFRSTSYSAGKEVVTYFTQAQSFKMAPFHYMLELGCFLDKNDQGAFYVMTVNRTKPRPVKKEHLEKVEYWAHVVSTTKLKVDKGEEDVL